MDLKAAAEGDVREDVPLTPKQTRTSCRVHVVPAEGVGGRTGEELLRAVCRHLSLLPDIRWTMVEAARERLVATGPPSAEALADMLVDVLRRAPAR